MQSLADNINIYNKKLFQRAIPNFYKLYGYNVIIIKPDKILKDGIYINDPFKRVYGSEHSSTYDQTSKTIEITEKIIIPNIQTLSNLYNDTEGSFSIYHTKKDLLNIGDILKIPYNNKLYEYKCSSHPTNYYDIIYEFRLSSMYMGIIN